MSQILKFFLIIMGMSTLCCCSNDKAQEEPFTGGSEIYLYSVDTTPTDEETKEAELLWTGDDILWFNQRTREIKFKDFVPTPDKFPPYKKVQFKLGDQVLFEANAYVNAIYSQIFTDLVIFHDLENDTYYLNDCYPPIDAVRNLEETKANIQAREKNWNLFLDALKAEKKLK